MKTFVLVTCGVLLALVMVIFWRAKPPRTVDDCDNLRAQIRTYSMLVDDLDGIIRDLRRHVKTMEAKLEASISTTNKAIVKETAIRDAANERARAFEKKLDDEKAARDAAK